MAKTKDIIQVEALDALGDLRLAGLEVSMGVGKTLIGLKHQAKYYTDIKKYLVVAPKVTIFDSWKNEAVKHNFVYLLPHNTFTTYRSLPKQSFDYDCVYLDECHSLKATHNKWLLEYVRQGGRVVGLTGTYPTDTSSEKGKMCNFYCPRVYRYLIDEAITDDILNDYRIFVHELELSAKPTIKRKGIHGEFFTSEMKDYQYWTSKLEDPSSASEEHMLRIQRMKCLQNFESKEKYAKLLFDEQTEKTIVFANTMDQADRLCQHSFHSGNHKSQDNFDAFNKGFILKMSAVEQLNEGVNMPGLTVGIIMHSYSNNRKSAQKLGRFLRLNPDDVATLHILCYVNSVDKEWVTQALKGLDQSKISWIKPKFYAGVHY